MKRAVLVVLLAACGTRGAGGAGPVAKPAPIEIDWPDAATPPPAIDAGAR